MAEESTTNTGDQWEACSCSVESRRKGLDVRVVNRMWYQPMERVGKVLV